MSARTVTATVILLSVVATIGASAAAKLPDAVARYEITPCYLTYDSHGCEDNGPSAICWQEAIFERYGISHTGGKIPLSFGVTVHAECAYVHLWVQKCTKETYREGTGRVSVRAQCFILHTFSGLCFYNDCWCSCTDY
jgi:hypothetical protein